MASELPFIKAAQQFHILDPDQPRHVVDQAALRPVPSPAGDLKILIRSIIFLRSMVSPLRACGTKMIEAFLGKSLQLAVHPRRSEEIRIEKFAFNPLVGMNIHKDADLTTRGREEMALRVDSGRLWLRILMSEHARCSLQQLDFADGDPVRRTFICCASSASVLEPLLAANATIALKAGECDRRHRLVSLYSRFAEIILCPRQA